MPEQIYAFPYFGTWYMECHYPEGDTAIMPTGMGLSWDEELVYQVLKAIYPNAKLIDTFRTLSAFENSATGV